jgi:hypothetical protein
MRTSVRLDDQLLRSAKRFAHDTGKSLTAVIEDALRQVLSRRTAKQPRHAVTLTTAPVEASFLASIWTVPQPFSRTWNGPVVLVDVNVLVDAHRQDSPPEHWGVSS